MSTPLSEFADLIDRLHGALRRLEKDAGLLRIDQLDGREWFDLLTQKLVPQLRESASLVVAVVGGTNIGKSVVFNHIAGEMASASSPTASGTKHPVCLVPARLADETELARVFPGFRLTGWESSQQALEMIDEHTLFWRQSAAVPENLLVLDTPDIDSDAPVNWERADRIRRSADVLVALLTQQKYNDAAVKQFFRKAAEEEKTVLIVFNQVLLPEDEEFWPKWVGTFTSETGIEPELVYLAPNDRKAAQENRLPFHERSWPPGDSPTSSEPRNIRDDLSTLHFDEIKLKSLRGSLKQVSAGVPGYLKEIVRHSGEFRAVAEEMAKETQVHVDWPAVPRKFVVEEIHRWWEPRQAQWARNIKSVYGSLTRGITWPFRKAKELWGGEAKEPWDEYREAEWNAVLEAVGRNFDALEQLSRTGHPLYRDRFQNQLEGKSRAQLLDALREELAQVELAEELRNTIFEGMNSFEEESPAAYAAWKRVLHISAAARPITSVTLFLIGFGPGGEAVAASASHAIAHSVGHVAADLVGGTTFVAGGEAAMSTAAAGTDAIQAKFLQLQTAFTAHRVTWLTNLLKQQLLGTLPDDLQTAALLPDSRSFADATSTTETLVAQMKALTAPA